MARHIARQVHEKFKVFSGELAGDGTIGKLPDEVSAFPTGRRLPRKVLAWLIWSRSSG
jgi:hypothetical protein